MSWDLAEGAGRATTRRSSRPRTSPTPSGSRRAFGAARGDRRPGRPVEPPRRRRGSTRSRSRAGCAREGARPAVGPAARPRRALDGRRLDRAPVDARPAADDPRRAGRGGLRHDRWEGLRLRDGSAALRSRWRRSSAIASRSARRCVALDVGAARASRSGAARRSRPRRSCARSRSARCATSPSRASPTRGCASLHRQRQALAAKVVAAFPGPGLARRPAPTASPSPRASSARPGRRGATRSRCSSRPSGSRTSSPRRRPAAPRSSTTLVRLYGEPRASPTRCSSATGASTRSPRATSRSGRRATSCAVGPLHGTHEPPFYVCGSDHWVAGYMEGAVRTGRAAAAAALGATSATAA